MSHVSFRDDLRDAPIAESQSGKLSFKVRDEDGNLLASTDLTTLTLTLYNEGDGAIINSRNAVDVLNTNGGTVDVSGNGTMTLAPADNVLTDTTLLSETHVALFRYTWNGGAKSAAHEVLLRIDNLVKVP